MESENTKTLYGVVNLNLSHSFKRYIEHTARRGLRPEEIRILGLSKASQKKSGKKE